MEEDDEADSQDLHGDEEYDEAESKELLDKDEVESRLATQKHNSEIMFHDEKTEIRKIIPVPLRRVRTTRSSTHSHPFQVLLPSSRTLSHKSSFVPRT